MVEPLSAAALVGVAALVPATIAAGAATVGAAGTVADAYHSIHKDRKKKKTEEGQGIPNYRITETTTRNFQKGGNERVEIREDGSIRAAGGGPGDWSCGYSVTTRTVEYGPGVVASGPMQPYPVFQQPTIGYVQPPMPYGYGPPVAYGYPALPSGQPPPGVYGSSASHGRASIMANPATQGQLPPAYGVPPPAYEQVEKKFRKPWKW